MSTIPTPESIDAEFLSGCLHAAGHAGVTVRGFRQTRIGTGQIGLCVRFELDLEGDDPDAPRSLIGKFPSDDPTSRQTGVQLRSYLKEVHFYRDLQQRLSISTPRCYYADIDGEGPESLVLLEDLAPGVQGDQLAGCTPEVARAAVGQLVGLHAPSWNDPSLRGIEWLGEPSAPAVQLGRALYQAQLPGFLERFGPHLEPDERDIIERAGRFATPESPPFGQSDGPLSLVHVDYRLDNLLIDERLSPPRISAVDWQSITLGNPLSDVAYFIGAGLLPEDRRGCEREIVGAYHEALGKHGVTDYPWTDCWRDYRRGAFAGFAVTVIASMMVVRTERGDEMFVAMARRHSRHALDLDGDEFLD
ncbi:MAG: phosphotransferase [Myxococcales bacterium]|nr:phosphotransferase [Myxococcales bacterium]